MAERTTFRSTMAQSMVQFPLNKQRQNKNRKKHQTSCDIGIVRAPFSPHVHFSIISNYILLDKLWIHAQMRIAVQCCWLYFKNTLTLSRPSSIFASKLFSDFIFLYLSTHSSGWVSFPFDCCMHVCAIYVVSYLLCRYNSMADCVHVYVFALDMISTNNIIWWISRLPILKWLNIIFD